MQTGNATNSSGVATNANSNIATSPVNSTGSVTSGPSAGIVNSDNGSGSTNNSSATVNNNNTSSQQNSAQVANNVNQTTVTGNNTSSDNTGGNTTLKSGDANTTGTIINSLNTNVDGVSVAEFNVQDDQKGDLVLDFAKGCISNCGAGSTNLANTGNSKESTSSANLTENNTNNTFQSNDANVGNNMTLSADSGNNNASDNTGGNTNLQTGDANVSANVLTLANNNVAGNIVYTVVNVFGDLTGDIVMDKKYLADAGACTTCSGGDINAVNSGNGSSSNNNLNVDQNNTNNTFQSNDANIENNLVVDANTAGNSVSDNTNGNNSVQTGDTNVDANVLNVANSNVSGVWWLVLVNEAGNWVGKIVGSPDGSTMAGSEGTEFVVNDNGEIMAVNSNNGSNSNNNVNIAQNNTNTTTQDNKANIVNNVTLSANTGNNKASDNTGGNSNIKTGDANVVANIVNFVNNNITGGGKLFVTVVNVFGSWTGNFVTPDGQQESHQGGQNLSQTTPTPSPSLSPSASPEEEVASEDDNSQDSNNATTHKVRRLKTVAAAPVNNGSTGSGFGAGTGSVLGNSITQVAGLKIGPASEIPDGALVGKNKIKINLAWLVLALPLLGLIALSRIRIAYYTRKIKNKLESKRVEGVLLGSLIAACVFLLNRAS